MAKRRARLPSVLRTCNYSLPLLCLCLQGVVSAPRGTSITAITGSAPHFNLTPRSVEYSHGVPSPCNSHNDGSSPGLRVFHPSETLPLGHGPALPRTPPLVTPSPIARMSSPELSKGARGPRSPLSPAPERGVSHRRFGVTKTSTPRLGANSQVPPLTGAARSCVFHHSPSTGTTGLLHETF